MGFRGAYGLALAAALLGHSAAFAYSGGIAGVSGNPSASHGSGATCLGCHSGANNNYLGYTALINGFSSGTTVVQGVNTNASVTVSTSHSGANAPEAGLNVSVTSGTLSAGSGTRITTSGVDGIDGELTHTAPQALSGAFNASWTFTFNPAGSTATVTMYVCVNPVDNDGVGIGDDGDGPADCRTRTFDVNSQPVISAISNQSIQENGTTSALPFTVSDAETAAISLTVSATGSTNPTLVPLGNVAVGGSGSNRTVTVTPAANEFGSSTITLTLSDGTGGSDTEVFTVTVNDRPTISNILDRSTPEDTSTGAVAFTVGDTETAVGSLTLAGSSGNTGLVPDTNIVFGGSGANRTVTVTPAANQSGTATITVTVSDGSGGSAFDTFLLTVTSDNDQPIISAVANQVISEDGATSALGFMISDPETAAALLTVSGSSSNTTLVPNGNIVFGGSGSNRNVTVTPAANQFGTATITLTVSDGSGGSAQEPFVLTVNNVNDAPVLQAIPDQGATDFTLFQYQTTVADADPGDSKSYGLSGEVPAWLGISSGGLISGTPPIGTDDMFNITVTVTDGAGASDNDLFVLTVTAPDTDGDQMPDSFENLHGFDPNDPSDADADADGDGVSNRDEYLGGTDPTVDDIAPVVTAPADLVVPSTGYLTVVDIGAATATDGLDGTLTATANLPSTLLRPGRYEVTWTAQDSSGNFGTDTQQVDVLPLASVWGLWAAGEGGFGIVIVQLNGTPPEYPVEIAYALSGTAGAADSDAVAGTFTFDSPSTLEGLVFDIADDGVAEGDETLTFTLTSATQASLGTMSSHTLTITDGNLPPSALLSGSQSGLQRLTAYQGDGLYTLNANAFDPGGGGSLTYAWSGSDDALGIDGDTTSAPSFDPSGMAAGAYAVHLTVSDGLASAEASVLLLVAAGTSAVEDTDLDGVADDVDSVLDYPALLENQAGDPGAAELLETDSTWALRRGRTSLAAGRTGALISMSDIVAFGVGEGGIALGADSYHNVGGIFDFEVHNVVPGGTARVVLPLQTAIREGSVYRKFDPANGWHDFVVDANNTVASARSVLGLCPGPSSDEYVDGLQPFFDCVRLTLQDGGPNDADGVADRVIRDPGGVAVATATGDDGAAPVNGGAFFAFWLALAAVLRLRRRAAAALLTLVALLAAAPAQAEHHIRIHYSGDMASGFDNNVTTAQDDADIRESGFASASGNVDYFRQLNLFTSLQLRGSLQGEYWNSFDGLNNGKATAMARLLYRANGDFFTPTLAAWMSASVWEFDSAIRDSNEYRAGAYALEQLTTQLTGRFALMANLRESDGEVFDLSGYSASLNVDWVPAPRSTVYGGYQYYVGGVTSTATPSLWIGVAAEAIEADDAFGGLAGGLKAYRLDATAQIFTLGYNYAITRKLSVDAQGLYVTTSADFGIEYQKTVGVISLLARF
jgi:hypothetical protein